MNSKAPVCEDFLKGYCADGDEVSLILLEIYWSYKFLFPDLYPNWRVGRCMVFPNGCSIKPLLLSVDNISRKKVMKLMFFYVSFLA